MTAAPRAGGQVIFSRKQRFEQLRSQLAIDQSSFISHWRDLNDYILPRRGRFQVTDSNRGDRRNLKIIDSTATFSARTLSSGMMSGITSPARAWFRLTTPDPKLAERAPVKIWLDDVTDTMRTILLRSNAYNAFPTVYQDMGVFATAAMMLEEDDEDVIRCYPFAIGSYLLANDHKLRVRTFIREFRMTVRQMVEKFGYDKLSVSSKAAYDRANYETWVPVVHIITSNELYDSTKLESKYKPFASCYYEKATGGATTGEAYDLFLEEMGFDEFPVFAPRWAITGEDVYGTDCPGMIVLGDVKQLQTGEKRGMQAIEKMVNPPMVAPTNMRSVKASILPGEITYDSTPNGTQGFRPAHEVKPEIQQLEFKQKACRSRIQRGFFEDLFLMQMYSDESRGTQPVTAAEIAVRQQEKMLAIGPVLEQLNQDFLDPFISRLFAIMLRRGLVPPPPRELEGMDLKVEYISIMHAAQKAASLGQMDRFAALVAQLAAVDPTVLDKMDRDQFVDEYGDMTGIPPRIIVSDEQVAVVRQARAEAKKQEQAAALAQQTSQTAKNLSQADTTGKNALTDVLNSQGTQ
jgi:hypothetical protein